MDISDHLQYPQQVWRIRIRKESGTEYGQAGCAGPGREGS